MKGAHTINSGDDYTVIATDDDGDGVMDDVHYVHTIPRNTNGDYFGHQPEQTTRVESGHSVPAFNGGGSLPWKKIAIVCAVILVIYGLLTAYDYITYFFFG